MEPKLIFLYTHTHTHTRARARVLNVQYDLYVDDDDDNIKNNFLRSNAETLFSIVIRNYREEKEKNT